MEHLVDMDQVHEGIGLRGYAQRDPMVEYKKEGHERFGVLIARIYATIGDRLSNVSNDVAEVIEKQQDAPKKVEYKHGEIETGVRDEKDEMNRKVVDQLGRELKVAQVTSSAKKPGRNDPCFCGSGKKFKTCHGKES